MAYMLAGMKVERMDWMRVACLDFQWVASKVELMVEMKDLLRVVYSVV